MEKRYFPALEPLRGLAALMVILVHCVVTWTPEFSVGFQNLLLIPISGRAPVILFFVLSGFVLASSFDGYSFRAVTGYYVRRLFRIFPLAWVGLIIALLVAALTRQWVPDLPLSGWLRPAFTASTDQLPGSLLFANNGINPVYWTLHVEIVGSIVLPLMLLNAPLALILCFGLQFWPTHLVPLWVMTNMLLFSFAAGVLAFGLVEKVQFRLERYWGIGGAILLVFAHAVIGPRSFSGWHLGSIEALRINLGAMDNLGLLAQHSLETIGAAVLVAVLACNPIRLLQAAPLRMLGQISYSVYVAHIPALILVAAAVSLVTADPTLRLALMVVITVPLSVAVATMLYLVVEKPGMGLGRNLQSAVLGLSSFAPREVRHTVDSAERRQDLESCAAPEGYSPDEASAKTAGQATDTGLSAST
ncbi:acyltransferase [Bradyrhizobium sp. DOA1]|uniref:acyltransferase family protein n=1 Tax=Bradyrhizobium sp. DOA1 TaxID=1126616 RepID=UPI00077CAE45|nr:acyltransferase [Bradyrhizobium sp. DOA1]KYH00020.1 hypothetical protein SE91_17280 [Bradyrhizobium sp. DOA1]